MTPDRDMIMEVAIDDQGKNKINDYRITEVERTERGIQYVYPFFHIFEEHLTSLHNFHMNINENMMAYNWPKFGTKSFFPKDYVQLAKSRKVTYHK
jgi:hypothetical protein